MKKGCLKFWYIILLCQLPTLSSAQHIFTINDLEKLCLELKNENMSQLTTLLAQYGYNNIGKKLIDAGIFGDKYGNSLFILNTQGHTSSLSYTVRNGGSTVSQNYIEELKEKYNHYNADIYYSDGKCRINYIHKTGIDSISMSDYSKLRAPYPVKKSGKKIEITSHLFMTEISIKKGDKVSLSATGEIVLGTWAGSGTPDGINGYQSYNMKGAENFRHGALIGKIGEGDYFLAGSQNSFIAENSGKLMLFVNDADPENNSGSFIVEYGINQETKSQTPARQYGPQGTINR